jgi:hypothetical protein
MWLSEEELGLLTYMLEGDVGVLEELCDLVN